MAVESGITVEEFERLPDALALNHELVNGQLVDVSGNTLDHNLLRDFLVKVLTPFGSKVGMIISEQDFEFAGNVHGPDVSFLGAAKLHLIERNRRVQLFVPDLAIEIVSESDTFSNMMRKADRYRNCGMKEVWLLDPENRQTWVFSEDREVILKDDQMFESKLIPGFSIRLGELFDQAQA
jgi:Uma2 family endonuclease